MKKITVFLAILSSAIIFLPAKALAADGAESQLLYDVIKEQKMGLDKTIDFGSPASVATGNGNGVNVMIETNNDEKPIYFFRGEIENNYLIFNNFCWRIVRTDIGGAIKILYNGLAKNGICNNKGTDAVIGDTIPFSATNYGGIFTNEVPGSIADAGWMYGSSHNYVSIENRTGTRGNRVTWDGSKYHVIQDSSIVGGYFYSCLQGDSQECEKVYYIWSHSPNKAYELTGGKTYQDMLDESFINNKNSRAKQELEDWYAANMINVTNRLADVVYCADRSYDYFTQYNSLAGDKAKPGSSNSDRFYFNAAYRVRIGSWSSGPGINYDGTTLPNSRLYYSTYAGGPSIGPTYDCRLENDRFTVSVANGNGKSKYPTGLLTADEVVIAGHTQNGSSEIRAKNFLTIGDNVEVWTMTPENFLYAPMTNIYGAWGLISASSPVVDAYYIQPVVALKADTCITSGSGTSDDPYIIDNKNAPCAASEDDELKTIPNPATGDGLVYFGVIIAAMAASVLLYVKRATTLR